MRYGGVAEERADGFKSRVMYNKSVVNRQNNIVMCVVRNGAKVHL